MPIIKQNKRLGSVTALFGDAGDLEGLLVSVSYEVFDDSDSKVLTTLKEGKDLWEDMTPDQRDEANSLFKQIKALSES